MAKQQSSGSVLKLLAWFTGIVVSLAVGMGLINRTLILPTWLGGTSAAGLWVTWAVGWVVVLTTLIGAIMALLKR
ncbi:MAG: hypothetical protein ABH804_00915 [archaeon]